MSPEPTPLPPPPDLYGRGRDDRFMRFLDRATRLYLPVSTRRNRYGRRGPLPLTPARLQVVVAARTVEAEDVVSLELRPAAPGGGPLPGWQPGAHLDVDLPSGLRRQYSLNGDPADRGSYRIAVRRIDGGAGGSLEVHQDLAVGSGLTVSHPRNAFPFAADPAVLLIAGGIGITPLLPMAREAARRGLDWRLVHTGRSRASMPFAAELAALDPDGSRVVFRPDDEHGGPADAAELLGHAPAPGAAVYVCGPAPMLDAVRAAFDESPARALHFERFSAAPVKDGRPFTLRLRRSGVTLAVPADRSALDVLRDHDPATPYSCRQGFCGVCRRSVTAGTVEHRDRRLSDQERAEGQMLVCVSRAPEGECLELDG
ncbi:MULTISPECIES: PDR/VanB family oxidoreductase [Streptacidiphilus]|uniref:2Fe-2S iron-sulfur cluster-binding protein n=1 Tax=Streptacidiphilus cavernicola TaxID=3342716 RepID=A0ABV6UQJ6_9ACTN|nr:PDR/VanB family oxidoreductase [Streptacidiphilus jeojiense]